MVFHYLGSRRPVDQLRREMDRLFNGWLGHGVDTSLPPTSRGRPAVNLWETKEALHVELELPGVKSDELDISVAGGELTLAVQRPEVDEEDVTYHRRERGMGPFSRVIRLPLDVDAEQVEAELRHGVLTINLPKAESSRPRKIKVATA